MPESHSSTLLVMNDARPPAQIGHHRWRQEFEQTWTLPDTLSRANQAKRRQDSNRDNRDFPCFWSKEAYISIVAACSLGHNLIRKSRYDGQSSELTDVSMVCTEDEDSLAICFRPCIFRLKAMGRFKTKGMEDTSFADALRAKNRFLRCLPLASWTLGSDASGALSFQPYLHYRQSRSGKSNKIMETIGD